MLGLLAPRNFLIDPDGLRRIIEERLPYRKLEQARIPLHVVATDILAAPRCGSRKARWSRRYSQAAQFRPHFRRYGSASGI
jgi:hypothetical protein